ncbi:MAG TPA: ATP-dependent DNA helicase [Acidimicrobiales bacterium]|nr:ATP-dependent DNA helicase [Acidimicrobiales bacterium]
MKPDPVAKALDRVVSRLPNGGETRDGQREMALAVARSIDRGHHLVVRAGTGTGKSLAYLVPAVLSEKKVVIATATKALQHQLFDKDLPSLAEAGIADFDYAILKGRSNYLCVQRLREASESGQQEEFVAPGEDSKDPLPVESRSEQARAIIAWARTTKTGDQTELDFEPDARVWGSYSVSPEECPGAFQCPSGGSCFAETARQRAAEADVVVVNLHLLGAHLASAGAVLPEHDVLIVDEAHDLEEVLSKSLGVSISAGRLRAIAALARASGAGTGQERDDTLDQAALLVLDSAGDFERELAARAGDRIDRTDDDALSKVMDLLAMRLERLDTTVRAHAKGSDGEENPKAQRSLSALSRLRNEIAVLHSRTDDQVAWVEFGTRPSLEIAPIDIAPVLSRELFSKMPVILTSATVPLNLGVRVGASGDETEVLDVGSPFNFAEQALLYCAAHLPDRREPGSETALTDEIVALLEAAGGRALVLFTARAVMERVAASVRARTALPILVQGERAKSALMAALGEQAELSLFATMGLWQGVDVPGAALSLVIIDRIPFSRPDDPLLQARRARAGARAFAEIDLPKAASLLAQGAGRLIRTSDDRGVVAVLDSRLASASYRWELIRALPPMRRTRERSEAESFLRDIDSSARSHSSATTGRARRRMNQ